MQRLSKGIETRVRVRIDAGFTGNPALVAMEERDIKYLGRLRSNETLQTLAALYLKRPPDRLRTNRRNDAMILNTRTTAMSMPD